MKTLRTQSPERPKSQVRWSFRRIVMGLVLAVAVGGIAAPAARADDNHYRRDDHHDRDHRHYDRDRGYYAAPVYAPPPVYYAPPPPPAALNFVFPLQFR